MMLQFGREIPIRIVIEKASSERRGFLFYLAVGFAGDIDPLTGMVINLVDVDQWLTQIKSFFETEVFQFAGNNQDHALLDVFTKMKEQLQLKSPALVCLSLREERGWSLHWNKQASSGNFLWTYSYFLEALPFSMEQFDLMKVELRWLKSGNCSFDLQSEGVQVIKRLQHQKPKSMAELRQGLHQFINLKLPSGSCLQEISIHSLGYGVRWSI